MRDGQFDPWMEVDAAALRFNVKLLSRLSGGKPVMAVVKNNGYGVGHTVVARLIEDMPEVIGFADVKTEACLGLRAAGIRKPVLLIARAGPAEELELAASDIQLGVYTDDARRRLEAVAAKTGRPVQIQLDVDTGMSRMGIPHPRAASVLADLAASPAVKIRGTFTGFTEDKDFDVEQLRRLRAVAAAATACKVDPGLLHAASSHAICNFPKASLDLVRPGISIYGAYPTDDGSEKNDRRAPRRLPPPRPRRTAQTRRQRQLRPEIRRHQADLDRHAPRGPCRWLHPQSRRRCAHPHRCSHLPGHRFRQRKPHHHRAGSRALGRGRRHRHLRGPRSSRHPSQHDRHHRVSVYDVLMHLNPLLPKIVTAST